MASTEVRSAPYYKQYTPEAKNFFWFLKGEENYND